MNTLSENILLKNMGKPIYSITPFTLLDYPDKTACIIWFAGCNMRCTYCYNPDIVLGKGNISVDEVAIFLKKRAGLLDGVVFSGGECTLHPEIFSLAQLVKDAGMLVKIDTNGTRPDVIRQLAASGLMDYVALDYKAPPEKLKAITGFEDFTAVGKTVKVLLDFNVTFEVRTTVHSKQLHDDDLVTMNQQLYDLGYKGVHFLQHFQHTGNTLRAIGKSTKKDINPPVDLCPLTITYRNT